MNGKEIEVDSIQIHLKFTYEMTESFVNIRWHKSLHFMWFVWQKYDEISRNRRSANARISHQLVLSKNPHFHGISTWIYRFIMIFRDRTYFTTFIYYNDLCHIRHNKKRRYPMLKKWIYFSLSVSLWECQLWNTRLKQ